MSGIGARGGAVCIVSDGGGREPKWRASRRQSESSVEARKLVYSPPFCTFHILLSSSVLSLRIWVHGPQRDAPTSHPHPRDVAPPPPCATRLTVPLEVKINSNFSDVRRTMRGKGRTFALDRGQHVTRRGASRARSFFLSGAKFGEARQTLRSSPLVRIPPVSLLNC